MNMVADEFPASIKICKQCHLKNCKHLQHIESLPSPNISPGLI